jgi:PhzF family phenazine biosynthesis protein
MKLPLYQVDAFAKKAFEGNPAAICPLQKWLPDEVLLSIAEENNLSETAFFISTDKDFHIRWFTPTIEVDLCGHATLAAAFIIFNELNYKQDQIIFESKSGSLTVTRNNTLLVMDFPAQTPVICELPGEIEQAFSVKAIEVLKSEDYIIVVDNENDVLTAKPNLSLLNTIDLRGVIITARSNYYDFVSRFFAPKCGIDEDPVTGSAHTQLVPYWANQLDKNILHAKQLSSRGGELYCENLGNRVTISGYAIKYLQGEIEI